MAPTPRGEPPRASAGVDAKEMQLAPEKQLDSPAWRQALEETSRQARTRRDPALVQALIAFYERSKGDARAAALEAIWLTGQPQAVDFVLSQARDGSVDVRGRFISLAQGMAREGPSSLVVGELAGQARDGVPATDIHLQLLGRLEAALQDLAAIDPDEAIKDQAKKALERIAVARERVQRGEDTDEREK